MYTNTSDNGASGAVVMTPTQTPEAEFVFGLPLDQQTTREFGINLISWSDKNREPTPKRLRVNMNSGGGLILDSLYLKEQFGHLRAKGHHLTLAAMGRMGSCAGWLLQCADERLIGEDSWLLIHSVTGEVKGNYDAVMAEAARIKELEEQTFRLLCGRSNGKLTMEKIYANISGNRDWWLNAKTSLEYGLVDRIEYAPAFPNPALVTTTAA